MRVEYTPNRVTSSDRYKYRVVIQDGYLYFNDLDQAIKEAWAQTTDDTLTLPDGTVISREPKALDSKMVFDMSMQMSNALLGAIQSHLEITKGLCQDIRSLAMIIRAKCAPGSPECIEAQRIMDEYAPKESGHVVGAGSSASTAGIPPLAEMASGTSDTSGPGERLP